MHCTICDKNLKDHESVRRHGITGEFLDLCDGCLKEIPGLPTKGGQEIPDNETDPFEDAEDAVEIEAVSGSVTNCYKLSEEDN